MNDRTQPFHTETVLCAFHHLIPQLLLSAVLSTSLCLHAQVDCLMNAGNFTTTESWGDGLLVLTAGNEALTFPQENSGFSAFPFGVNTECEDEEQEAPGGTTNRGMSGWDEPVSLSPYPTPNEDVVNVLGSGFDNESPIVVRVRDGIGRIVKDRIIQPNSGSQGWVFDVRSWPSGIYTVEGTQGKKHTSTRCLGAH